MTRYHYIDDQGNISDALPLAALHKIALPPATKVLLEGGKQWTTLEQVSHGGPVVLPVAPPIAPVSPPPTAQVTAAPPPCVAATATPAKKGIPKIGKRGWLGVVILFFALLTLFGAQKDAERLASDYGQPGDDALARAVGHSSYTDYLAEQNRTSGAVFIGVGVALIIWGYRRYNSMKSGAPKAIAVLILAISSLGLVSCGHKYTEQEMAGVFKSEATPTITVTLSSDSSSLTDFGGGTTFRGRWNRVGDDGICVATDAGGEVFYQIDSLDRIKSLMKPEDIKLIGLNPKPFYNRVK